VIGSAQIVASAEPSDVRRDEERVRLSVVIPCLNEEQSIAECVTAALAVMRAHGIEGEVVVADNDSDDASAARAAAAGARVVHEPVRGYGSAYLAGLGAARGRSIVMFDADLTYDAKEIPRFLAELEGGADLVIGDRMDNIQPGAMPWLHRYVGNPILSGILNVFFRSGVRDAHCGMRGIRAEAFEALNLRTTGMEFASEMVIRAVKADMEIRQFPIDYHPRAGESKLSSFRDGWRHLRTLLVHSPTHLFIVPGAFLAAVGSIVMLTVLLRINVFGHTWQIHTLIAGSLLLNVGVQINALGVCARAYSWYILGDRDAWMDRQRKRWRLEHGLALGGAVLLAGVIGFALVVGQWIDTGFGALAEERLAVAAATLIVTGLQVVFSSFLLSVIGMRGTP
jgi:glycosyltransferase involved in cell wall biosynthesis